jgi:hypothetical protein
MRQRLATSVRWIFSQGFRYQVLFCFVAIFLLFNFTFFVNSLNLKYHLSYTSLDEVINLVFVSSTVDKVLFYLSSSLILLFPMATKRWVKAWKLAVACYLPLLFALVGFFFQMAIVSQVFFWLSSLLFFVWIFFLSDMLASYGLEKRTIFANISLYVCVILVIVEFLGLVHWVLFRFADLNWGGNIFEQMAQDQFGMQFSYIPSFLSPFFVVFAMFFWFLVPVRSWLKRLKTLVIRLGDMRLDLKECLAVDLGASGLRFFDGRWRILLLVAFSLCLSFLYGIYAYLPVLSGQKGHVGADVQNYVYFIDHMKSRGWMDAMHYAFFDVRDRSLSLIIFYAFSTISGLSSQVIAQFASLVLGPLTVLATFFFMREAGLSKGICGVGGLFAAFSFLTIVGFLDAFLSNWMALVMVLFFSGLLVKALRFNSWFLCSFASLTLVLILFMHIYTWDMVMAALVLFCFVLLLKWFRSRSLLEWVRKIKKLSFILVMRWLRSQLKPTMLKMVLVIVVSNFAVDVARNFALGSGRVVVAPDVNVARSNFSFDFVWGFWPTLNGFLNRYMVLFANPIMFIFVFLGIVALLANVYSSDFSLYLLCWTVVSSVPMLFGDETIQFRLLYNMPMHVLAALGVVFVNALIQKEVKGRVGRILCMVFMVLAVLVNVSYALHSMIYISMLNFG